MEGKGEGEAEEVGGYGRRVGARAAASSGRTESEQDLV